MSATSHTIFCAYISATEISAYQDTLKSRWNKIQKAVGIQSARCIKSIQENVGMMFENSGNTTGRLIRLNANASCESDAMIVKQVWNLEDLLVLFKTWNLKVSCQKLIFLLRLA